MPRTRAAWKKYVENASEKEITKETALYILEDWKDADNEIQDIITKNETVKE